MKLNRKAVAAVKRGAKFLDKKRGSGAWRRRIRRRELDLSSTYNCVLGQVYGDYFDGLAELGLDSDDAQNFGFDSSREYDCEELDEAWLAHLREHARQGRAA